MSDMMRVKITDRQLIAGQNRYGWKQQTADFQTGADLDPEGFRYGTATLNYAVEINNAVVATSKDVWIRQRGLIGGNMVYEFVAPGVSSGSGGLLDGSGTAAHITQWVDSDTIGDTALVIGVAGNTYWPAIPPASPPTVNAFVPINVNHPFGGADMPTLSWGFIDGTPTQSGNTGIKSEGPIQCTGVAVFAGDFDTLLSVIYRDAFQVFHPAGDPPYNTVTGQFGGAFGPILSQYLATFKGEHLAEFWAANPFGVGPLTSQGPINVANAIGGPSGPSGVPVAAGGFLATRIITYDTTPGAWGTGRYVLAQPTQTRGIGPDARFVNGLLIDCGSGSFVGTNTPNAFTNTNTFTSSAGAVPVTITNAPTSTAPALQVVQGTGATGPLLNLQNSSGGQILGIEPGPAGAVNFTNAANLFSFSGQVTATGFNGPGGGLTGLNASNVSTGTLSDSVVGTLDFGTW